MAAVPICYKLHYKDQNLSIPKGFGKNEGYFMSCILSPEVKGCFPSNSKDGNKRRQSGLYGTPNCFIKGKSVDWIHDTEELNHKRRPNPFHTMSKTFTQNMGHEASTDSVYSSHNVSDKGCVMELSSAKRQLKSLDSYFRKLQKNANQPASDTCNNGEELFGRQSTQRKLASLNNYLDRLNNESPTLLGQSKAVKGLESLEHYLGTVNEDASSINYLTSESDVEPPKEIEHAFKKGSGFGMKKLKSFIELENASDPESSYDNTSSLYLMGILASVNIAVFLFEIATPVRNSDLGLFSLPLFYGAKINHLILIGEWWRLVTPMFLHSGIHHVALGCWILFTFGPQVCRAYGSFTFIMLYVLGGLSGNFTSFLHTPEPTVGGTGPVFAILGAWLICQTLDRNALGKVSSERMFQKAILATAVSCIISNFGPIDDWTHFGAAFTGIAYGFLTCPIVQMNDASSKAGEEGITLVRRYIGPCKSLIFFSLFILILVALVFLVEPPLAFV